MSEPIDWSLTTWEGNRRRQHLEFRRLSFREKMKVIEELCETSAAFRQGSDPKRTDAEVDSDE